MELHETSVSKIVIITLFSMLASIFNTYKPNKNGVLNKKIHFVACN